MADQKKECYSFSKLNSFSQCRYGWFKTYVEHSKQIDNFFSLYGTFVHELCQKYAEGEYTLDSLADLFEWGFEEAVPLPAPPNKWTDLKSSYITGALDFFHEWEGYDGCQILGVEEHFKIPIADFDFQGFIDISFVDEKGRYVLRDYKSHKKYSKKELAEAARQPYLYSAYFKEAHGRYPDVLQFYTFRNKDKRVVEIPFNEDDMNEAIQWAIDTVGQIRQEWEYEKNPDPFFCTELCGHRENCKWGQKWRHYKRR